MEPDRWTARALLAAVVTLAGALRLRLALTDDGIYWPDEIYQSLEPAHRWVYGYGLVAWEFVRGARNWAFPGLVTGLLGLARAMGLDSPPAYLHWVRGVFAVGGALSAWAVYRLARSLGADLLPAAAAAGAWGWGSVFVYFGHRAMSEGASALFVPWGLALALPHGARLSRVAAGTVLLGAAVLFRLHNALFCAALLGTWIAQRRWRDARLGAVLFALAALGLGLLDRITWGHWFHSTLEYLRFNLLEGKAAQWGTSGPAYYLRVLTTSMPLLSFGLIALGAMGLHKAPALGAAFLLFFLAHAVVPHKELRFLLPALPLLCALAALGASALQPPGLRYAASGVLLLFAAISALRAPKLTFGDLGQYEGIKPGASAYDDFGSVNRLLSAAGREPDLCGVKVEGVHLAWTGGYTYLHRPVPLYGGNGPPRHSGHYLHVVAPRAWSQGARVLAQDGDFALLRLEGSGCVADPRYTWLLP